MGACDVDGWADSYASEAEAPEEDWIADCLEDPTSEWTWPMASACSASLWHRCEVEKPERGLASIQRWLSLPGSPGLVYVAGVDSSDRNQVVFPALEKLCKDRNNKRCLRLEKVKGAEHDLNLDAPQRVKTLLADVLLGRNESEQAAEAAAAALLEEETNNASDGIKRKKKGT